VARHLTAVPVTVRGADKTEHAFELLWRKYDWPATCGPCAIHGARAAARMSFHHVPLSPPAPAPSPTPCWPRRKRPQLYRQPTEDTALALPTTLRKAIAILDMNAWMPQQGASA